MDIQAYISSGVLELYVIGQLSPREMREVEKVAREYPAVKQELTTIEQTLEAYSLKNQTAPPPGSFDKIKAQIKPTATKPVGKSSGLPLWLGLLLGTIGLVLAIAFFSLRQKNQDIQQENSNLNLALSECEAEAQRQLDADRPIAIIRENGTSTILLTGTEANPDLLAAVYFNPLSQKSYLDPFQLPDPTTGKQDQLWALIDGQPTDMGVFDLPASDGTIIEVPFIANADAFAITLEPAGGSVNPTLTDLQVIGNRT